MSKPTKGVAVYLLISFGLAWLTWGLAWALNIRATDLVFQAVSLPAAFAPAIAAVVVRRWVTHEGFADAGLRPRLRNNWRLYMFAWLLPIPVVAVVVVLAVVLGVSRPDWTLQRALTALYPSLETQPLPAAIRLLVPVQLAITALLATPILWGEEFGWRGYLQPRLLAGRPLAASVATGLIWGAWHYPIVLMGYERYSSPLLGLLLFPVLTVLLSIIFGWLFRRSGSIWAPSLAHAATNVIGGNLSVLLFFGVPKFDLVGYNGVLAWLPLAAVCAWIVASERRASSGIVREQPIAVDTHPGGL